MAASRPPSCKNSNRQARLAAGGYWGLVAVGEPFRLLFPLGVLAGSVGVLLWPLYVWQVTETYPAVGHARVMVEGFLSCFVVGFLGTALPRLIGVPRLTLIETLGLAAGLVGIVGLQAAGRTLWGDVLFLAVLGAFVCVLGARSFLRKDVPPPAFVLVLLGVTSALLGVAIQIVLQVAPLVVSGFWVQMGRLLLYQGYILLPVMGVGAFLLPRFFGLSSGQNFPESEGLPPGWLARAGFALVCGGVVLGSFVLEAMGELRWGFALRAIGVFTYLIREIPFYRAETGGGSLGLALRVALVAIPLGFAIMAVWPESALSFLHVVYISGFSLRHPDLWGKRMT